MKINFYLALAMLFIISCGPPEFKRNTRVLVIGKVVDQNNVPIKNAEIIVSTVRPDFISGNWSSSQTREYRLGQNFAQSDGRFAVTSLFDNDEDFQIEVHTSERVSNYIYAINTLAYTPDNLMFDLKTVTVHPTSLINYNIKSSDTSESKFRFSFEYVNATYIEFYNEETLDEEKTNVYKTKYIAVFLDENRPEVSDDFKTLLGSTVRFRYSKNEEPEVTETFIIDKENYEFNFLY